MQGVFFIHINIEKKLLKNSLNIYHKSWFSRSHKLAMRMWSIQNSELWIEVKITLVWYGCGGGCDGGGECSHGGRRCGWRCWRPLVFYVIRLSFFVLPLQPLRPAHSAESPGRRDLMQRHQTIWDVKIWKTFPQWDQNRISKGAPTMGLSILLYFYFILNRLNRLNSLSCYEAVT